MAIIKMTGGFSVCPEGTHVFRIFKVDYDADFGKIAVHLINAKGVRHIERFNMMNKDGSMNDKACNRFSFFAKTALNDFRLEEIDHNDLINRYIKASITHSVLPRNDDPTQTVTFANMGEKWPADGFDTEPVKIALTLGNEEAPAKPVEPVKPAEPAPKGAVDLNRLLN